MLDLRACTCHAIPVTPMAPLASPVDERRRSEAHIPGAFRLPRATPPRAPQRPHNATSRHAASSTRRGTPYGREAVHHMSDTIADPRTLAEVEADLGAAGALLANHRSRQGDTVNFRDRRDGMPALLVRPVDWLLEEWVTLHGTSRLP